ncbi:MAG: hypothetical protein RIR70_1811 [Pseudomonadota bacterium]|jgi:hypothetical protein
MLAKTHFSDRRKTKQGRASKVGKAKAIIDIGLFGVASSHVPF